MDYMKKYRCTRTVEAMPMTRGEAESIGLVRDIDTTKSPREKGYKVIYEDGYQSWSPADVFEEGYEEC